MGRVLRLKETYSLSKSSGKLPVKADVKNSGRRNNNIGHDYLLFPQFFTPDLIDFFLNWILSDSITLVQQVSRMDSSWF